MEHARNGDIDAEERPTGHDLRVVDAGKPLADDLEALRILERDGGRTRHRHIGRFRGERAITQRAAASAMNDEACRGAAFRGLDVPALRRRRHQHLPRGRSDTAQRVVVERGRPAAAGELLTKLGGIERRFFDMMVTMPSGAMRM
jgi:hypothetical protein